MRTLSSKAKSFPNKGTFIVLDAWDEEASHYTIENGIVSSTEKGAVVDNIDVLKYLAQGFTLLRACSASTC